MTAKDLKNALLQEAVQGRLVPQMAAEGNARDLLKQIAAEKVRLVAQGKIKKEKPLPPITADEIPFDIPENWCWCRLGEVCDYLHRGKSPTYGSEKILPIIAQKCNQWDKIYTDRCLFADKKTIDRYTEEQFVKVGDTIINSTGGGTVGRTGYIDEYVFSDYSRFVADSHVTVVRGNKLIVGKYIYYYLITPFIQIGLEERCSGSTNQIELGTETIRNYIFPLPPLSEQKRIVSAIEQFMPLIEEYGKREEALRQLNASIGEQTKKALLQEAVQGRLVPQNPAEGTATQLLKQIQAEKAQLIKAGKLKKEKPLPPITPDEIPFDIPENWCWCRLGDLYSTLSGLSYKKETLAIKSKQMIRVLRGGNILDTAYVIKDDDVMISSEFVKPELILKKNYLITPAVTSLEHIGKIGRIEKDYTDTVVGGFVLMLIPNYDNDILSQYSLFAMSTHWFRCLCKEITHKSGQAFYNLSREKLLQLPIPLPPLTEQKRIVRALETLLPLCESLGR